MQVQHRLQHAAAYRQGLVRGGGAVLRLAPGVHVSGLHTPENRRSIGQNAPQYAVNGASHGLARHLSGDVSGPDHRADFQLLAENPISRGPQHPLPGVSADEAGNVGVGQGAAPIDHPAQGVAPHGLHHGVAVLPRREARTDAHDNRRIVHFRAQVALGQNGVHQGIRPQAGAAGAVRVRQHRDQPLGQQGLRLVRGFRPAGGDVLHRHLPQDNGLGKAHRPADGRGGGQVGHDHLHPGPVQAQGDAGGDVPGAANENFHKSSSISCRFPKNNTFLRLRQG